MWVAIVGSRTYGQCPCLTKPAMATPEHRKTCPALTGWLRVLASVTKLAQRPDLEGVVSGGALGADTMAEKACELLGVRCQVFPVPPGREPFWKRAKDRNTKVVERAGMAVILFGPGARSAGSTDTLQKALSKGIPCHVWHEGRWSSD